MSLEKLPRMMEETLTDERFAGRSLVGRWLSRRQQLAKVEKLARLCVRWERIQPSLVGALDQRARPLQGVRRPRAGAAGVKAILDVHNYAKGPELGALWERSMPNSSTRRSRLSPSASPGTKFDLSPASRPPHTSRARCCGDAAQGAR